MERRWSVQNAPPPLLFSPSTKPICGKGRALRLAHVSGQHRPMLQFMPTVRRKNWRMWGQNLAESLARTTLLIS